jgi:hypothetical protein
LEVRFLDGLSGVEEGGAMEIVLKTEGEEVPLTAAVINGAEEEEGEDGIDEIVMVLSMSLEGDDVGADGGGG